MNVISAVVTILLCFSLFAMYFFVMIFLHRKIGDWYVGRVKALREKDMSVYAIRNMTYPWLILGAFLLPVIAYVAFRPSFIDPSWLCVLFAGVIVALFLFQVFQYIWLYYRTKNSNK